ncbi:hypothetical protein [Tuberibacillus calidus]|uniref:hypothetical protein n=1 Tax=Tuberibacillus calidus TaxID=340097 RepID=UPI00041B94F1|nr:hypothetical protein [Tuberibacillus calidus]
MERYIKISLGIIVSVIFLIVPRYFHTLLFIHFKGHFIVYLVRFIGGLIQLIGLIAFVKFAYLWVIELWKIK